MQRPAGDSEVICYRRLPSTATALSDGCSFTENPSDEPTAIFRYGSGSSGGSWYEATILTYAVDGELREEAVYQAGNTTTPFRRTTRERNPLGFTTFEKTGALPNGAVERTTRQFGADGLVAAQSTPYFAALDFCGTPGAPDDLCTKFQYWNTGRLKEMRVKPLALATDITVCLDYDAHGNVTGVKPGCTTTAMHGYVWDDFGNVIEAKLANVDPTRPHRFEYDARGNLIRKGVANSGTTTSVIEWDYDMLNRPLENRENGNVVLQWSYDGNGPNLPSNCTGLVNTDYQVGRLTAASDAVWTTWYSYDAQGRVIREARVNVQGTDCYAPTAFDLHQTLERTFTSNGNVATLTYPSGRQVEFTYDATGRVSGIGMTTWDGSSWTQVVPMLENVTWFPGGTLKGYDVLGYESLGSAPETTSVSYRYGANASSPTAAIPSTSCSTAAVNADQSGDSSARLRAIYVTRSGTDVLRLFYRWKGEQLIEQSRCYLNATVPQWEFMLDPQTTPDPDFQYDVAGRLGGANMPNYDSTGGYGHKRVNRYDTRSNRTKQMMYGSTGYDFLANSGFSWAPDRMTRQAYNDGWVTDPTVGTARDSSGAATVVVKSGRNRDYTYDGAGRVIGISAGPALTFDFDNSGQSPTGTETVMRTATTAAGTFNYFYDSQNRRIRKQYPNGDVEGFFWGGARELLMETAPTAIGSGERTMDEYVWLAGRPVLMLRSLYGKDEEWLRRQADWASLSEGLCPRRDETGTCRPNAIITDIISKPVATVDSFRRIAGVLEYDPFGRVNRTEHWGEVSPHPNGAANPYPCVWVASQMNPGGGPLARQGRINAPRVDVARGGSNGCVSQWQSTPTGTPVLSATHTCGNVDNYWAAWTPLGSGENLHLMYCPTDNGVNYSPQAFGVAVRGFEYRRHEDEAVHYLPPFRFPGQYYDAETDLHENWNRYYDPSTGRYLSPEPLLQSPDWVASQLRSGRQVPSYSYAGNNPVANVDPNGLETQVIITGGAWPGTHAAVRVDNGGSGDPVLFDPGGSYGGSTRPSGGYFEGSDANLGPFAGYHGRGEPVLVLRFPTTAAQEADIASRFGYGSAAGPQDVTPGLCAATVSSALSGIGPFSSLQPTVFPASLARSLFPSASSWSLYAPGPVNVRSGNIRVWRPR
ncbi:MAG: RHS repeat-associated core domain-containing protein [Myxococcales bacterium]|nr:RHS repeat-associated core domain-containing protein [Myxococcales bacterium]